MLCAVSPLVDRSPECFVMCTGVMRQILEEINDGWRSSRGLDISLSQIAMDCNAAGRQRKACMFYCSDVRRVVVVVIERMGGEGGSFGRLSKSPTQLAVDWNAAERQGRINLICRGL